MKRYVIKDFWHAFRQSENKKKKKSESSAAVFLRSFSSNMSQNNHSNLQKCQKLTSK